MDRTKEEILKSEFTGIELAPNAPSEERECIESSIYSAMNKYAEQEAKSFSHWLQHQEINKETTEQLWVKYQKQVS